MHSSVLGRPYDYIRSSSFQLFNFKSAEFKSQNFGSHLLGNNRNTSKLVNREFNGEYELLNGVQKFSATENVPLTESEVQDIETLKSAVKNPSLIKVQEVSGEDEYTPSAIDKQFYPARPRHVWEQIYEGNNEQDLEKIKAEKRRQIEEEMFRELNENNKDVIKEVLEQEEECDSQEPSPRFIQKDENEVEDSQFIEETKSKDPIRNSLFKGISLTHLGDPENLEDLHDSEIQQKMQNEEGLEKGLNDTKNGELGIYWTWDREIEKDLNGNESGKEKDHEPSGVEEKLISIIDGGTEEIWSPEKQNRKVPIHDQLKIISTNLEKNKLPQENFTELSKNTETQEEFNETQMQEVEDGEGTVFGKQNPTRYESEQPLPKLIKLDSNENTNY